MNKLRYLLVGLLAGLPAVRSVPWPGPIQTIRSECANGVEIPSPTDGPKIELVVGELKRDLAVLPNTCGWVDGNSASKYALQHKLLEHNGSLFAKDELLNCFRCMGRPRSDMPLVQRSFGRQWVDCLHKLWLNV